MAVKQAIPAPKKSSVKKAIPEKVVKPEPKNEATTKYHLVKRSDGKWEVKNSGGKKAIKLFDTQKEALEYSKQMAKNQGKSMVVHSSKGPNKGRFVKK